MTAMTDQNVWKFDYDPESYRGRRVTGTYQALCLHSVDLAENEIEDFDFSKLDDSVRLPIMYAVMLHNDWKDLNTDGQPTFKEFCTAIDHPDFGEMGWYAGMDKPENLGFIAKPIPGVRLPNIPGFSPNVGKAMGALNEGLSKLDAMGINTDVARQRAVEAMNSRLKRAFRGARKGRGTEEVHGKQGDDDGNSKTSYSGGTVVNPTGLSLNNKPVRVSFNTGIEIAGEPKFYLDGKEETSPIIMKTSLPGIVSGTADDTNVYHDPQVYAWLSGPITNTWIAKLQSKIVWTNQIADVITNAKIVKYFNYLITALYIYFFYTSVIAYTDDPRNRNAGLYALRDQFTASDYVELSMLKLNIQQSLIPPFIMRMCHYFSGNFKQSMDPGAPLIKLVPWKLGPTTTKMMSGLAPTITFPGTGGTHSALQYANKLMRDNVVRDITAVLARSYPSWMGQDPMGYESLPEYDSDFVTFFNNASYTTMSSGHSIEYLPEVSNANDVIAFNVYSDAPDGWISSMISINDSSTGGKMTPGLALPCLPRLDSNDLVPITSGFSFEGTRFTTEFIYSTYTGVTGWWPTSVSRDFAELVSNTYQAGYSGVGYYKFQRFGTGRLNFVNRQMIIPRVLQMLELIYTSDIDDIVSSSPARANDSGRRKRDNGGGRNNKGKGRGRNKGSKTGVKEEDVKVTKETKFKDET